MIEPILALLQVQVEGATGNSVELLQSALTVAPEALDPVDMMRALHELVVAMIDSIMLTVSDINQAIISAPAVRVDDGSKRDVTANNGLQCGLFAVRHDLCVNASVTFEDAEDDCFTRSATTTFSTHAASAEVRLVNLDLASSKGRCSLTFFSNTFSDFEKDRSHAAARQLSQLSRMTSCQIEREMAHELTHFTLANFRPLIKAV